MTKNPATCSWPQGGCQLDGEIDQLRARCATLATALVALADATDAVVATVGPNLEHIHEPGVERLAAVSWQMIALLDARAALTPPAPEAE